MLNLSGLLPLENQLYHITLEEGLELSRGDTPLGYFMLDAYNKVRGNAEQLSGLVELPSYEPPVYVAEIDNVGTLRVICYSSIALGRTGPEMRVCEAQLSFENLMMLTFRFSKSDLHAWEEITRTMLGVAREFTETGEICEPDQEYKKQVLESFLE